MDVFFKIWIFNTVFLSMLQDTQNQSVRLRQALLATGNWLNDVDGDNIPGQAGLDYPVHSSVPEGTSFRCKDYDYAGYFADVEADCQAYHVCFPDGRNASFLCVNGTVFHQRYFVCDWWFHFNCSHAPSLYEQNLFRKIPLPVLGPVRRLQFSGPIPQPKVAVLPPAPQQRGPKKLNLYEDDFKKDEKTGKKVKDQEKPQNSLLTSPVDPNKRQRNLVPVSEVKYSDKQDKDKCDCQCGSTPSLKYISSV
ncbi:uncharacterized protein LOC129219312 [Uloborus diversus]|uniref:uncharacterized protein LOC129219312 n=1 Tax=Uloborus diversus TaxID=327109 RepID=UPI0024090F1E|nr:uncharacterized protein LOC129219312 [Uloborus diversus]